MRSAVAGFFCWAGLGLAGALASAAPVATLDLKVRLSDGMPWSENVPFVAFQRYEFALFVSYTEGVALSDVRFNITGRDLPVDSTVHLVDPGLGDQAPFDAAAEANAVFWSVNAFRIDAASDVADSSAVGLRVAQLPPLLAGGAFSTDNPALVMRFDLTVGHSPTAWVSQITPGEGSGRVFTSAVGAGAPAFLSDVVYDGARIFVPAPSAAACVSVGAIALRRRRGAV